VEVAATAATCHHRLLPPLAMVYSESHPILSRSTRFPQGFRRRSFRPSLGPFPGDQECYAWSTTSCALASQSQLLTTTSSSSKSTSSTSPNAPTSSTPSLSHPPSPTSPLLLSQASTARPCLINLSPPPKASILWNRSATSLLDHGGRT
jgi:hypothetical protein